MQIRGLFLSIVFLPVFLHAQISGIINTYAAVTNISGADITVTSTAGFAIGDKVLIIQMKGADVDETNTAAFGDIVNYNSAGHYEFSTISSISGLILTLQTPPCRSYEISGSVQIVSMPVYGDITISGTLTCSPWNGSTGGVLAFEATGTVTLAADIVADGQGFAGGSYCYSYFSCGVADYYSNYGGIASCVGGEKGESIAVLPAAKSGSRGKVANGGGGSNSGQHGGGGGGNYGSGGLSGYQWTGCFPYDDIQATAGVAIDYLEDRAFLGGGGGGGHQDNGLSVTNGSNGGAIVIINAAAINGSGFKISARGSDVTAVTDSEGAGAGGGGGTVILRTTDVTSSLTIDVSGGYGGSINSTLWAGTCHGPGGGGGGGYIGTSLAAFPVTVTTLLAGGDAGIITSPGAFCDGTSHGAEPGDTGGVVYNLADITILPIVYLGNDTSFCAGNPILIDAGAGFTSYVWNTGATTQTISVGTAGFYSVTVTNAFGCQASDTMQVIDVFPSPPLNFPDSILFCQGNSINLDAGSGYSSYLWSTGATTQSITISATGIYYCTVSYPSGCSKTDSIIVPSLWPQPSVNLGSDTALCAGDLYILDAYNDNSTYTWQDESTASTYNVLLPGVYSVTVKNEFGCAASDEVLILDGCNDDLYLPNAFSPNNDGLNDYFKPVPYNTVDNYDMQIWTRWGEMVFESKAVGDGWDGNIAGKPANIDTYIRIITYEKPTESGMKSYILKGTVTLLR